MEDGSKMALIRHRLKVRAAYLDITISDMARKLGISDAAIHSRLQRGVKLTTLEELAALLGVPVDYYIDPDMESWRYLFNVTPAWVVSLRQERKKHS